MKRSVTDDPVVPGGTFQHFAKCWRSCCQSSMRPASWGRSARLCTASARSTVGAACGNALGAAPPVGRDGVVPGCGIADAAAAGLIELGLRIRRPRGRIDRARIAHFRRCRARVDRKRLGSRALAQTEDHDGRKAHRGAAEIAHAAISSPLEELMRSVAGRLCDVKSALCRSPLKCFAASLGSHLRSESGTGSPDKHKRV